MSRLRKLKTALAAALFERRYGVETANHEQLDPDLAQRGYVSYEPSGWLTLRRALPPSEVGREGVFVDLGCGKGRIVLQAAIAYPLARVIGVELSADLVAAARTNVERNRSRWRAQRVDIVQSDVLDWEPPEDLSIVYLHNPFTGDVFSAVAERLAAVARERRRSLRVVYLNPVEHERLLAVGARQLAPQRSRWSRMVGTGRGVPCHYVLPAGVS